MNNDLCPPSSQGGEEVVADTKAPDRKTPDRTVTVSLDELLTMALAGPSTAPVFDLAHAAACAAQLTDADRAALAKLPTPQELARRIVAENKAADLSSAAAASTFRMSSPHEDTQPKGAPMVAEPTPEFEALLERHDACLQNDCFHWDFLFTRKDEIGQGGQGAVYLVENEFMGEKALKVMSPLPYGDARAYYDDMQRMRAVASIVHQNSHDNLVQVERFESFGDTYCMLMKLITGFDLLRLLHPDLMARLKQYLQRVDPKQWAYLTDAVFASYGPGRVSLQPGIAVYIIHKCLLALKTLHALHKSRIIHGDIKPSNIMLSDKGCVKLIDIGSAFQLDAPPSRFALSPRYAPPEVLEGGPWTPQGDFASLGYVLVELLTGRPDLGGQLVTAESGEKLSGAALDAHLKVKRDLAKNLRSLLPWPLPESEELMELCTTLVQNDPAKRFDNAELAIACAVKYRNTLVMVNMAMAWPMDIQSLVSGALAANAKTS